MAAPKDNNHNPNGRPIGSQNKVAREIKEKITMFLDASFSEMVESYKRLSDEDKVRYYEKLMPYCIPKTAAVTFEVQKSDKPLPSWMKEIKPQFQNFEEIEVLK